MGDNTVKRPILTYAEDGQYWNYIEAEFVKRLPISGMCWDAAGRSKSIPPLEMDIQKFSSDLFPKTAPGVQHNVYFIHLFLVGCDVCFAVVHVDTKYRM